jgi:exonuclease I
MLPTQAWPVQLSWAVTDAVVLPTRSQNFLISPPEGAVMSPGAEKVHGKSMDLLRAEGKPMADVLKVFAEDCRKSFMHVAYNLPFDDFIMVSAWMRTFNTDEPTARKEMYGESDGFCAMRAVSTLFKTRDTNNGYRNFKLSEAYRKLTGEVMVNAHDAQVDVNATVFVLANVLAANNPEVRYPLAERGTAISS